MPARPAASISAGSNPRATSCLDRRRGRPRARRRSRRQPIQVVLVTGSSATACVGSRTVVARAHDDARSRCSRSSSAAGSARDRVSAELGATLHRATSRGRLERRPFFERPFRVEGREVAPSRTSRRRRGSSDARREPPVLRRRRRARPSRARRGRRPGSRRPPRRRAQRSWRGRRCRAPREERHVPRAGGARRCDVEHGRRRPTVRRRPASHSTSRSPTSRTSASSIRRRAERREPSSCRSRIRSRAAVSGGAGVHEIGARVPGSRPRLAPGRSTASNDGRWREGARRRHATDPRPIGARSIPARFAATRAT